MPDHLKNDVLEKKVIGSSDAYFIRKYGLYQYQAFKLDPTGREVKVGPENIYGIVASDIVDTMFRELSGDK